MKPFLRASAFLASLALALQPVVANATNAAPSILYIGPPGFSPQGNASLSPSANSVRAPLPPGSTFVVYNTGGSDANIVFGDATVTATVSTGDVVKSGGWMAFAPGSASYVAAYSAGSTSILISGGSGAPAGSTGGVSTGGGGSVPTGTAGAPNASVVSMQGIAGMTPVKVDGSGATQPISGSVTTNAGTNTSTALLALETGGHLASIDSRLSGFAPASLYATLSPSATSSRVALPAGSTIVVYNTGSFDAMVTLGGSSVVATATGDVVKAGGWMAFAPGSNGYLAAISPSGTTALILSGGAGLPNGSGSSGGSGGGGGAITAADCAITGIGCVGDAAWGGTGSATLIALGKAKMTAATPAGTNHIGSVAVDAFPSDLAATCTGTISAADTGLTSTSGQNGQTILTGTPTANSSIVCPISGQTVQAILSGTFSATLRLSLSADSVTYVAANAIVPGGSPDTVSSFTAPAAAFVNVAGWKYLRLDATAYTSGSPSLAVNVSGSLRTVHVGMSSTGANTVTAPSQSMQIGGDDPSGNLQALQLDASKNLKVNIAAGGGGGGGGVSGPLTQAAANVTTASAQIFAAASCANVMWISVPPSAANGVYVRWDGAAATTTSASDYIAPGAYKAWIKASGFMPTGQVNGIAPASVSVQTQCG
jgi:hypothetical protein